MQPESVRPARESELDEIYKMGFDTWSEGQSESAYLEACRSSPKYKRGTWYVLASSTRNEPALLSSLIVYRFEATRIGIGSIATPARVRRRGHASRLVEGVIGQLEASQGPLDVFLYSDISPEFYERLGFRRLPAELQRYKGSVCMLRACGIARKSARELESGVLTPSGIPDYF